MTRTTRKEFVALCWAVLGIAPHKYQLDYMEKQGLFKGRNRP